MKNNKIFKNVFLAYIFCIVTVAIIVGFVKGVDCFFDWLNLQNKIIEQFLYFIAYSFFILTIIYLILILNVEKKNENDIIEE